RSRANSELTLPKRIDQTERSPSGDSIGIPDDLTRSANQRNRTCGDGSRSRNRPLSPEKRPKILSLNVQPCPVYENLREQVIDRGLTGKFARHGLPGHKKIKAE